MNGQRMKLVYLITSYAASNTGNGGHFHSVKTIAEAVAAARPDIDVRIVSIGDLPPKALLSAKVATTHLPAGAANLTGGSEAFRRELEGATHVHAFDRKSYFFALLARRQTGAKVYQTKPGGANARWFPYCGDVFLFSAENLEFLKGLKALQGARLHHIPGRIRAPTPDPARIAALRDRLRPGALVLLRIGRIGRYYEATSRQTLNLAACLRGLGLDVQGVLLGTIEHPEVHDALAAALPPEDLIVTDPLFTRDASALLPVADLVVGTGRSAMEAVLADRIVFAPLLGAETPERVTAANIDAFVHYNFSERTVPDPDQPREPIADLAQALGGDLERLRAELRDSASRFGVEQAVPGYLDVYAQPQAFAVSLLDRAVLWFGVAKVELAALRSRGA